MGHNESFPSVCQTDMSRMSTQSLLHVKIEDLPDMDVEELDKKFDKTMATVGAMVQEIREHQERPLPSYKGKVRLIQEQRLGGSMVGSDRLNVPAIDNSSHWSSSTA